MPQNVVNAEKLNERLIANPFNSWMGLSITNLTEESIEIRLQWREEMISNPKARVTHGGILGALVDVAADFMIGAKVGTPVPTVDRGLREVVFCSIEIAGERPSIESTSGFCINSKN